MSRNLIKSDQHATDSYAVESLVTLDELLELIRIDPKLYFEIVSRDLNNEQKS